MTSSTAPCRTDPCVVLVVDDEPLVRHMTARLVRDGGYEVLEAANGLDALDLLRHGVNADLVLSDVTMPHMDGAALARVLRRDFPKLPVVLVSGYSEYPAEVSPFRFLAKPFSAAQLLTVLGGLIEVQRSAR